MMQYLRAYQFVFNRPAWVQNLLYGTLCQLIPVAGPMVLMGYLSEACAGDDTDYPDFDFSRFMIYLKKGVWPFLASLIGSLAILPLAGICAGIIVGGGAWGGQLGLGIGVAVSAVIWICGMIVFNLALTPVMLRATLLQNLGGAFSWSFVRDFAGRMWREMILMHLFLMISIMVVFAAGALLLCVGIYPAGTLTWFAYEHLMFQLYRLYLTRGGMPIVDPAAPAP